ncbi:anaphase-promoting complex subunit 13 [Coccinella septempunctata]|uniref:anaphase-promoting complex subunit 13 n=1 Tax=Coccinella septempunctata TaxID=41139 RepID=UPI001D07CB09|nr:anaphase-promoting complex subunit 13 [Coccinella septempunctata]
MDGTLFIDGFLVDLIDDEWRSDKLPTDDIEVPTHELSDPEADAADSHISLKEQEQRWSDVNLNSLIERF